jgi:hypothetical protein
VGRRYSIHLYFPVAATETALEATAAIASPDSQTIEIRLPWDRTVLVPFSWRLDIWSLTAQRRGRGVELGTSLLFPLDDALRADGGYSTEVIGDQEFAEIGIIYLTLRVGCRFTELSFQAATAGMSDLFLASHSVQNRFRDLLARAGGLVGWFNADYRGPRYLDDPSQPLDFDYWAFAIEEDDDYWVDADGATEAVCQALGQPVPQPVLPPFWADWNHGTALQIARVIRTECNWADLPILADALEEAGVTDAELLGHFRQPGEHDRTCGLLDCLLGMTRGN